MAKRSQVVPEQAFVIGPPGNPDRYVFLRDRLFDLHGERHLSSREREFLSVSLAEVSRGPKRWVSYTAVLERRLGRRLKHEAELDKAVEASEAARSAWRDLAKRFGVARESLFVVSGRGLTFLWEVREELIANPARWFSERDRGVVRHTHYQPTATDKMEGRQEQLHELVSRWLSPDRARRHLLIGGDPNIGKSTLALGILNADKVRNRFPDRRFDVRCDDLATYEGLLERIGVQWFEDQRSASLLLEKDIVRWLSEADAAVVIDNYETFLMLAHTRNSVYERAEGFLKKLAQHDTVWLIVAYQGHVKPAALQTVEEDVPDDLTAEDCVRIFVANCSLKQFVKETDPEDLNRLLIEAGLNPYAAKLLGRAVNEHTRSFKALNHLWSTQRSRMLNLGREDFTHRGGGVRVAYSVAFKSLYDLESQVCLLLLAHLPAGIADDDHQSDLDTLFSDVPHNQARATAVFRKLYERAVIRKDRNSGRVLLLDPFRFHLLDYGEADLIEEYRALPDTDVAGLIHGKINQAVVHYSNLALAGAGLGGREDGRIIAEMGREFSNIHWAVSRLLATTSDERGPDARKALDAVYGLSRYCNWTGKGREQCDDLIQSVLNPLPPEHAWRAELFTLLGENKRMQEDAVESDKYFNLADDAHRSYHDDILKVVRGIGHAENAKTRFDFAYAKRTLVHNLWIARQRRPGPIQVIDKKRLETGVYWRLAEIDRSQYKFSRASVYYGAAERRYRKGEKGADPQGVASCLVGHAEISRFLGDFDRAEDLLHEALELYASTNGENYAAVCKQAIAEVFLASGSANFSEVLSLYDEAAKVLRTVSNHEQQASWCAWGIGETLRLQGQLEDAKEQLQRTVSGSEITGFHEAGVWSHWSLAEIEKSLGKDDTRLRDLALSVFDQFIDPLTKAWKLRRMGDLAWQHRHAEKAALLWSLAVKEFEQGGYKQEAKRTEAVLAYVHADNANQAR